MEFVEYLKIKDNIILDRVIGAKPKEKEGITYLYGKNIQANVGEDIRLYEDVITGKKKSLKKLVEENLIQTPEGKKLNAAGTDFVDLTDAEKVAAGIITLKPDEKIDGDHVVKKTKKELYAESLITASEYNAYIDTEREAAYRKEADPLGMQVLRGDIERNIWLAKIDEIKKRFPKVTE